MIFMYMSYLVYDKPSSDPLNLSQELREELQRLKDQTTPNHQVGDSDFIAKFLMTLTPGKLHHIRTRLIHYPVSFLHAPGDCLCCYGDSRDVVQRQLFSTSGCSIPCNFLNFGPSFSAIAPVCCGLL